MVTYEVIVAESQIIVKKAGQTSLFDLDDYRYSANTGRLYGFYGASNL